MLALDIRYAIRPSPSARDGISWPGSSSSRACFSLICGACGLLLGFWGTDALQPLLGDRTGIPPLAIRVDARLLAFTALISVTTGLLFGTVPVVRYAGRRRFSINPAPATSGRLAAARALVVVQLALSLVLVAGAGLFVRTLQNLRSVEAGFARDRILMLRIDPHAAGYDAARRAVVNQQLRTAIAAVPGVRSTSQSGIGLMSGRSRICCITVPGYTPAPGERMAIRTNDVTPEYFSTVGMTVLGGRGFAPTDSGATSPPVSIN